MKGDLIENADLFELQGNLNSYLGLLQHYNTFKLRSKIIEKLNKKYTEYIRAAPDLKKLVLSMPLEELK